MLWKISNSDGDHGFWKEVDEDEDGAIRQALRLARRGRETRLIERPHSASMRRCVMRVMPNGNVWVHSCLWPTWYGDGYAEFKRRVHMLGGEMV